MSLSNYPPGVSGNELQIAGPDREWSDDRECEWTVEVNVPVDGVYGDSSASEDVEVPCGFSGEVELWSFDGAAHWTCPECDHEHDEQTADYQDPDMRGGG